MAASSPHLRFLLFSDKDPSSLTPRSAVETPQQLDWTSCSDQLAEPVNPLPPSGDDIKGSHKKSKFSTALLQMPCRHCKTCRSPLHSDDTYAECVSCLGKSHADAALSGADCSHCESFSLASLHLRIAFFSESDSAPRALCFLPPRDL